MSDIPIEPVVDPVVGDIISVPVNSGTDLQGEFRLVSDYIVPSGIWALNLSVKPTVNNQDALFSKCSITIANETMFGMEFSTNERFVLKPDLGCASTIYSDGTRILNCVFTCKLTTAPDYTKYNIPPEGLSCLITRIA